MAESLQVFKSEFFKALAHPVRISILEILRNGEKSVTELQAELILEQSAVSQQLSILRARGIIVSRKAGTSVYYQVREPLIFDLLEVARAIFNNHLFEMKDLLDQLTNEQEAVPAQDATTHLLPN